jgi:predicted TIM-barrel enzyme
MTVLSGAQGVGSGVYAGIFAVDVLQTKSALIRRIKVAGVGGVINFPSVSFIDGSAGETLAGLSLGMNREVEFLKTCADEGLRIGGVVGSVGAARELLDIGVTFLLAHGGPPARSNKDSGSSIVTAITDIARSKNVPVFGLSELMNSVVKK